MALIEVASSLKLLLYLSLIACLFLPWGMVPLRPELAAATFGNYALGARAYAAKLAFGSVLLALLETAIASRLSAGEFLFTLKFFRFNLGQSGPAWLACRPILFQPF